MEITAELQDARRPVLACTNTDTGRPHQLAKGPVPGSGCPQARRCSEPGIPGHPRGRGGFVGTGEVGRRRAPPALHGESSPIAARTRERRGCGARQRNQDR